MTFIVALQLEDGVALASDTRAFQLNDHYQLQAVMNTVSQKSQLWDLGIFASNGFDQIGQTDPCCQQRRKTLGRLYQAA